MRKFIALSSLCFLVAATSLATFAQEAEKQKNKAITENPRAHAIRVETIEIAAKVKSLEILTKKLDKHVTRLQKREQQEREQMLKQYDRLTSALEALLALQKIPESGLFIHPNDALAANRGQIIMAWLASHNARTAQLMASELRRISALQREIDNKKQQLSARLEDVALYRNRVVRLSASKQRITRLTANEQATLKGRTKSLVQDADSLRELLARLEQDSLAFPLNAPRLIRDFPQKGKSIADASGKILADFSKKNQGQVVPPISGIWLQRFGASDGFGQTARGILISAEEQAQVLAPFDGRVVFADTFLDQGKLLIIEHKGGYHTVISQFAEFFVSLGQWVLAGEPIGQMGKNKGEIYFEIRHKGKTKNPKLWIKETTRSRAFLLR